MENEANVSHLSTSEVLDAADEFSREVEGDEELQVPLAEEEEDAEEGENEGAWEVRSAALGGTLTHRPKEYAVKPQPPVFSRLASGVRKSLTNLFSFGLFSGSTEGNEKEEQGEASAANGQEPEDMEEELSGTEAQAATSEEEQEVVEVNTAISSPGKKTRADPQHIHDLEKRLNALTKSDLAAQLREKGEKPYGLKNELVARLRDLIVQAEGGPSPDLDNGMAANVPAAPTKRRGRTPKTKEHATDTSPSVARKAKRRKAEPEEAEEDQVEVVPVSSSGVGWPDLVPTQLPRAYTPLSGWPVAPCALPDPGTANEWDVATDEELRNKVATLRLWVLSQPIQLDQEHSKSNPTFFEALGELEKSAKETKKAKQERLQQSHALWVYGMEKPPHVPRAGGKV